MPLCAKQVGRLWAEPGNALMHSAPHSPYCAAWLLICIEQFRAALLLLWRWLGSCLACVDEQHIPYLQADAKQAGREQQSYGGERSLLLLLPCLPALPCH